MADEQKASAQPKYPDNFKDSLALLQTTLAAPLKDGETTEAKKAFVTGLRQHVSKIQQGLPVVPPSADDHAEGFEQRRAGEKRAKLVIIARSVPEVKELLSERDALLATGADKSQVAELQKQLTDGTAAFEELAKENISLKETIIALEKTVADLGTQVEALKSTAPSPSKAVDSAESEKPAAKKRNQ